MSHDSWLEKADHHIARYVNITGLRTVLSDVLAEQRD